MNPQSPLSEAEASAGLLAAAHGSYPDEAAARLLIAHGSWLRRADFREQFVTVDQAGGGAVRIDWPRAVRETAEWVIAPADRAILTIAASLAGYPNPESAAANRWTPIPLRWELANLDRRDTALVLAAISHTTGAHDHVEHLTEDLPNGACAVTNTSPRINLGPLFDWPTE